MDTYSLLKTSEAYKIFEKEKGQGRISHAILVECEDSFMLNEYVKIFAQTIMCETNSRCGNCRACKLIESENFLDVEFYPKGKKLSVSDVDDLVEKSYLKPLETNKKLFVLRNVQDMNIQSQNKLLKTLEEPPKDTYILLGATSTYPLLTTILSRVKKYTIKGFNESDIVKYLESQNYSKEDLLHSVKFSFGKVGEVINRCNNSLGREVEILAKEILINMKTSKLVSNYLSKINKENLKEFISVLNMIFLDLTRFKSKSNVLGIDKTFLEQIANSFSYSGITFISDKLRDCEKAYKFNGNVQIIVDKILFAIVEGRHKW